MSFTDIPACWRTIHRLKGDRTGAQRRDEKSIWQDRYAAIAATMRRVAGLLYSEMLKELADSVD